MSDRILEGPFVYWKFKEHQYMNVHEQVIFSNINGNAYGQGFIRLQLELEKCASKDIDGGINSVLHFVEICKRPIKMSGCNSIRVNYTTQSGNQNKRTLLIQRSKYLVEDILRTAIIIGKTIDKRRKEK